MKLPKFGKRQTSRKLSQLQSEWTQKKFMPGHIIIKTLKMKTKKNLKADKSKWHVTYRRTPIEKTQNFYSETMEASRKCDNSFLSYERKGLWTMNSDEKNPSGMKEK